MSVVYGSLLQPVAEDLRDITRYVDDALGIARTRAAAERFLVRLEDGLQEHASGRLRLKRRLVVSIGAGEHLDFLGYRVTRDRRGRLHVRPSPEACRLKVDRCYEKLSERFLDDPEMDEFDPTEVALETVWAWANSLQQWQPLEPLEKTLVVGAIADMAVRDFSRAYSIPPLRR
jgi:hypothetical protein